MCLGCNSFEKCLDQNLTEKSDIHHIQLQKNYDKLKYTMRVFNMQCTGAELIVI